jgi:hypothetical protein
MARGRNPLSVLSIAAPSKERARIPWPRRALTTQSKNRESWLTTSTDRIGSNLRTGGRDARAESRCAPYAPRLEPAAQDAGTTMHEMRARRDAACERGAATPNARMPMVNLCRFGFSTRCDAHPGHRKHLEIPRSSRLTGPGPADTFRGRERQARLGQDSPGLVRR